MSLLTEVVLGIYIGLLAGIIPALVAGLLGFAFKYVTGVSIPALAVVVLAAAIAGINGGLMGLVDEQVARSPQFIIATIVVMMLALYAHSQGDKLGANVPRRFSLRSLRKRTLSADVVQAVGRMGEATIEPSSVVDMEGYPPLSPELRAELAAGSWTFPADLPLSELESRLAERLRTEYDLADVSVGIDERGQARIVAAPPSSGLSRRIPQGYRAVSVPTLVPTGLARGDRVNVRLPERTIEGTVVSARSDPTAAPAAAATDGGLEAAEPEPPIAAPTTTGGEGRVTVAVPRSDAKDLLGADRGRVVVQSQGTRREFELISLLSRAGARFEKMTVRAGSELDGTTIGTVTLRDRYDVAIMAIKHPSTERTSTRRRWEFSPLGETLITAGDELFVVGTRGELKAFAEVVRGGDTA